MHRRFLVPGDPHAFLAKTPLIYSYYYDQGRRDYERTGESEAVLTTRDAETFSGRTASPSSAGTAALSRCAGRSAPRVIEEECRAKGGSVCRYRLSWS